MGNTHSTDTLTEALDDNLPARTTRAESSYIGPNFSFLSQAPVRAPPHVSAHHINHIIFLLRQKLIPDVIPSILHHAELFEHHSFRVDDITTIHSGTHLGKEYDCLTTPPLRSRARIKCPVQRIIFEIESREAVWERRDGSCCWTRFTAGILPPPDSEDVDDEARRFLQQGGLLNAREIGRHDSALREVKTYILQWTSDAEDEEERLWVRSLANGDRLVVRASALYPGFVNKIHTVRVALYMAAVV